MEHSKVKNYHCFNQLEYEQCALGILITINTNLSTELANSLCAYANEQIDNYNKQNCGAM